MSSMSKFVLEGRVASCSSFFFMYKQALSTRIVVKSDTTSKETKISLSSISISDNSLETARSWQQSIRCDSEAEKEYPLEIWMCCIVLSQYR